MALASGVPWGGKSHRRWAPMIVIRGVMTPINGRKQLGNWGLYNPIIFADKVFRPPQNIPKTPSQKVFGCLAIKYSSLTEL